MRRTRKRSAGSSPRRLTAASNAARDPNIRPTQSNVQPSRSTAEESRPVICCKPCITGSVCAARELRSFHEIASRVISFWQGARMRQRVLLWAHRFYARRKTSDGRRVMAQAQVLGIVGAGQMGGGIAQVAAQVG